MTAETLNNEHIDISKISYLHKPGYTRHISNNNPGALPIANDKLQGKIKDKYATDDQYEQFETYYEGVMGLLKVIEIFYFDFGMQTPERIINAVYNKRKQPKGFMAGICRTAGFKAKEKLVWNRNNLYIFVRSICQRVNRRKDVFINAELFAFVWISIQK